MDRIGLQDSSVLTGNLMTLGEVLHSISAEQFLYPRRNTVGNIPPSKIRLYFGPVGHVDILDPRCPDLVTDSGPVGSQ